MGWQTILLDDLKIIEIKYFENVTAQELMEALGAAMALHQSTGYFRYLADCTEMTGGHTVFDLYNVVANLENYQIDPRTKEALLTVPSSATAGDVRFYETAAVNRGFTVKLFTDREAALAWLGE